MPVYCVYVMASRSRVLYTGVTNDLARRVNEHKQGLTPGFTSRYRITRLVYFEEFADVRDAIAREKQIKAWTRARRIRLGSAFRWGVHRTYHRRASLDVHHSASATTTSRGPSNASLPCAARMLSTTSKSPACHGSRTVCAS